MCVTQGWGQVTNLAVLMLGLLASTAGGAGPYSHSAAADARCQVFAPSYGCSRTSARFINQSRYVTELGSVDQPWGTGAGPVGLQQQGAGPHSHSAAAAESLQVPTFKATAVHPYLPIVHQC